MNFTGVDSLVLIDVLKREKNMVDSLGIDQLDKIVMSSISQKIYFTMANAFDDLPEEMQFEALEKIESILLPNSGCDYINYFKILPKVKDELARRNQET